jgi:hypothetical protein
MSPVAFNFLLRDLCSPATCARIAATRAVTDWNGASPDNGLTSDCKHAFAFSKVANASLFRLIGGFRPHNRSRSGGAPAARVIASEATRSSRGVGLAR